MMTKRLIRLVVLALVVAGSLLTETSSAGAQSYSWVYLRNGSDPTNGIFVVSPSSPPIQFRGGSGTVANECVVGSGFLPAGAYSVIQTFTNHAGVITGPAIYIGNKQCQNGTWRTELFVHGKFPWPGSPNGYYSNGCIKLSSGGTASSPSGDIAAAVLWWQPILGIQQVRVV